MKRKNIAAYLRDFVRKSPFLNAIHAPLDPTKCSAVAKSQRDLAAAADRFFLATLDEVRLRRASELALFVLELSSDPDSNRLRLAVQRRELGQTTKNDRQRDHIVHTVNSYMLGWSLYLTSPLLRDHIKEAVERRGLSGAKYPVERAFRALWSPASLLHDIGYLFEGAVDVRSDQHQFEHASLGAHILNDHARSRALLPEQLQSSEVHSNIVQFSRSMHRHGDTALDDGYRVRDSTLIETATSLAKLGPLPVLEKELNRSLPLDIFDLWQEHHSEFKSYVVAAAIPRLRDRYYSCAYNELPGAGVRVIDHGVASGLMMTMIDSLFYELHFSAMRLAKREKRMKRKKRSSDPLRSYAQEEKDADDPLNAQVLWRWHLWSESAAALHNVAQNNAVELFGKKLAISDDPIAYLGILVDELQEWDRHTVLRRSAYGGVLPCQSTEVFASERSSGPAPKLVLLFERTRAASIREKLDKVLEGWENLVDVEES